MEDDDNLDSTGAIIDLGTTAKTHLRLLKLAYQRLGPWPKTSSEYQHLITQVQQNYSADTKDMPGPEKWQIKGFGNGKAEAGEGAFGNVKSWQLMGY